MATLARQELGMFTKHCTNKYISLNWLTVSEQDENKRYEAGIALGFPYCRSFLANNDGHNHGHLSRVCRGRVWSGDEL